MSKKIQSALISVYYKDNLAQIVEVLHQYGVKIYSTGGTQTFIEKLNIPVTAVENLTSYPSILGGRVKTLHPKIFGGILGRRDLASDQEEMKNFEIPEIDLVIVDLYPFEETLKNTTDEAEIIEKIDIGGISLIRAAAKNFEDVLIVASREQYPNLLELLQTKQAHSTRPDRFEFAKKAFAVSSHYDTSIFHYFNQHNPQDIFRQSAGTANVLRYGENPHQKGVFYGQIDQLFEQLNGKELSYNNLIDIDAALHLIADFEQTAFAILKHNNACGAAIADTVAQAYQKAFAADTLSAFGGVLITNRTVDLDAAQAMNELFFEILIAPDFTEEALAVLKGKKNRMVLKQKMQLSTKKLFRTLLNGVIEQDLDAKVETQADLTTVTKRQPSEAEIKALLFANKLVKHTKSNAIILANDTQLFASGTGQTSRVDALQQAIAKAKHFGFDLSKAVMASDAFFPFADCVEIAFKEGIMAVIQPGGSIRDKESIDYCDANGMAMVTTGFRHFKH